MVLRQTSAQAAEAGSYSPGPAEPQGPSLAQILAILRAYWKVSAIIFAVIVVLSGVVAKLVPKSYKATATLMVNYDVNDPLAAKDIQLTQLGSYMATQAELMQSPEILDAVIDRLNLAADPYFTDGNTGGAATLHDWIASQVRKNLDIETSRSGGQLIYISVYARDPNTAANVANAIGDAYNERHFEQVTGPAGERASRYTQELADLKKKVTLAQDSLTRLRQRTGQIDFDGKTDVESDNLTNLEHRLMEARAALRAAQSRVAADPASNPQVMASDLVRSFRGEAASLSARMAKLRNTLGPEHPQVIELQAQIDANAKSLAEALQTYTGAANADLASARRDVEQLEKAVQEQRGAILANHNARDEASKYQLELESAQSVYKRALDGYDQFMFASSGRNSNVEFASRARPPAVSEKRKTLMILLLGLVSGAGLGLALPFGYEMLNRRIRCRDDVEREFGVPVLVEFPMNPPAAGAA